MALCNLKEATPMVHEWCNQVIFSNHVGYQQMKNKMRDLYHPFFSHVVCFTEMFTNIHLGIIDRKRIKIIWKYVAMAGQDDTNQNYFFYK